MSRAKKTETIHLDTFFGMYKNKTKEKRKKKRKNTKINK